METVKFQIFMFSITLYGGIIIGILYDIYRALKGRKKAVGIFTSLWDILFLLLVFFILIRIIFSSNYGDLRIYVFIGFIVGFFVYEKIIGRIAAELFSYMFETISTMIKVGGNYAIFPIRLLWNVLILPILTCIDFLKKIWIKTIKKARIPKKALKDWSKYYKLIIKRDKQ